MRTAGRALAAVIIVGAGCGSGPPEPPAGISAVYTKTFDGAPKRDVDILFVIDDSPAMGLAQAALIRDFPAFLTALQDQSGVPNIHIGVISTDMGAGDSSIAGCAPGGKSGILQNTARGTCAASGLQG